MHRRMQFVASAMVIITVVGAWLFTHRPTAPKYSPEGVQQTKRIATRIQRLRDWEKTAYVPLLSPNLAEKLTALADDGPIPREATRVPLGDLTEGQRSDLYAAIAGLFQAYAKNSLDDFLKYMHGRKMRLSPIYRRWMERELTKSGDSLEELQALSDDQFYARCVCYVQCRHTGVLPTVSRVVIWRSSKIDPKSLADSSKLSQLRAIHDECGAMSGRVSAFVPEEPYTLEAQLMANKQVLVADVELVIRHGKDTFYHKCLYYLRLWFNEQHGFWQPVFLFYARIIYPSAPDDNYSDYWF